jgi:hypothetical protein
MSPARISIFAPQFDPMDCRFDSASNVIKEFFDLNTIKKVVKRRIQQMRRLVKK